MSGASIQKRLTTKLLRRNDDEVFEVIDQEKFAKPKPIFDAVLLLCFLVFIYASYVLIKPFNRFMDTPNGAVAKAYGIFFIAVIAVVAIAVIVLKKNTINKSFYIILFLALLAHVVYMLYTEGHSRQYDTWSVNDDGHYAYALSFYETGMLPDHHNTIDNIYQFYHPPLNAFVQGMFMRLFEIICPIDSLKGDTEALYSACTILSCFYMTLSSYFMMKTINLTKLSKSGKTMAFMLAGLFPRLTQMSGQLNNDTLSIVLSFAALYFFFRWYMKERYWIDIILSAFFVGAAMMAKLSAATICLGMAVVFIIVFVRSLAKKDRSSWKRIVPQYIVFLCISVPIGLWYQVYSHEVMGLPYGFVFDSLNASLFTGTKDWVIANKPESIGFYETRNQGAIYNNNFYNIVVRFILPFWHEDVTDLYCSAFNNYNVLFYAIRSSIFGEFSYWQGEGFALVSIVSLYVVYFTMIVLMVRMLFTRRMKREERSFLYLFIGALIMFIYLQIDMPFGCSMDFRYVVPIVLPGAYFFGRGYDYLTEPEKKHKLGNAAIMKTACYMFVGSSYLFYLAAI